MWRGGGRVLGSVKDLLNKNIVVMKYILNMMGGKWGWSLKYAAYLVHN